MKHTKTCYCCESEATSMEHIPPKCLFEQPRPSNLITVPSCDKHNLKKSKDDEYFRWLIATASSESKKADDLITKKIIPAFKRKPALLHKIWKGAIKKIDIYSDGGLYLYSKPGIKFDRLRIQNIINQICKGLFYHHFKRKFPDNYTFESFVIYPKISEDTGKQIQFLKLCDIGDGSIFSYRYMVCSEDQNVIIWFLMFFSFFLLMNMSVSGKYQTNK